MKFTVEYGPLTISPPLSITWTDFPTKSDCAVIVYFAGCKNDCPGCQNLELQNPDSGIKIDWRDLAEAIKSEAEKAHTNKIVFSGGDPFYQPTTELDNLICHLVARNYEVCIYTGVGIHEIHFKFPFATYYKCGKYDEQNKEKDWGKFSNKMVFATKNQRLYNKDCKQISVDNVYYFSKWGMLKAKLKKFFKII